MTLLDFASPWAGSNPVGATTVGRVIGGAADQLADDQFAAEPIATLAALTEALHLDLGAAEQLPQRTTIRNSRRLANGSRGWRAHPPSTGGTMSCSMCGKPQRRSHRPRSR